MKSREKHDITGHGGTFTTTGNITCGSSPRDWFFAENSKNDALDGTFGQCGVQGDVDQISSTNVTTTGYLFNINF